MRTKKERMYERIQKHGEDVKRFFDLPQETDPVWLCKRLRRLELHQNKMATDYCNGDIDINIYEISERATMNGLTKLLGQKKEFALFINGDPRGYALKIQSEATPKDFYRDMGGYGILAPDFSNE